MKYKQLRGPHFSSREPQGCLWIIYEPQYDLWLIECLFFILKKKNGTNIMPKPGEHKTVQARILKYTQEIGCALVSKPESEALSNSSGALALIWTEFSSRKHPVSGFGQQPVHY